MASRFRRLLTGGAAALAVVALSAGPVMAETELGHSGKVGQHYLNDNPSNPDVVCLYDNDTGLLVGFRLVSAPNIWARNRTGAVDHQQVGYKLIIKRWKDSASNWKTFRKSAPIKAMATDQFSAYFGDKLPLALYPIWTNGPDNPPSDYYVVIKMFWYRADGSVAGSASHLVDNYAEAYDGNPPEAIAFDRCYSDFQN